MNNQIQDQIYSLHIYIECRMISDFHQEMLFLPIVKTFHVSQNKLDMNVKKKLLLGEHDRVMNSPDALS